MSKKTITDDATTPTDELWDQYRRTRSAEIRNRLVGKYLYLVKMAAERVAPDLPDTVNREELAGAGALGLMQAIERYDEAMGAKFETYCTSRIRGAMLDELRAFDWMPRPLRTKAHKVRESYNALQQHLGRNPTDQEVAGDAGLTDKDYKIIAMHASAPATRSLHGRDVEALAPKDIVRNNKSLNPADIIEQREVREIIADVIRSLPRIDRLVILLYYYDRLTMRQIGEVLDITESRICQIHNEVLDKLHFRLRKRLAKLHAFTP
ncbi:MAG: FliA/WhiG family RNA polymerase sigma factor [Planctomycetes bacterium]|nr:FliA/WhiG family RNA polymerase sigma factor [Planctomycetota bacterium]